MYVFDYVCNRWRKKRDCYLKLINHPVRSSYSVPYNCDPNNPWTYIYLSGDTKNIKKHQMADLNSLYLNHIALNCKSKLNTCKQRLHDSHNFEFAWKCARANLCRVLFCFAAILILAVPSATAGSVLAGETLAIRSKAMLVMCRPSAGVTYYYVLVLVITWPLNLCLENY